MSLSRAYIGLGSNIGDRVTHLKEALRRFEAANAGVITQCSPIYKNRAIGIEGGHDFCNAVIEILTPLSPQALLKGCQTIEKAMGRVRHTVWTNRTIDLDILNYEDTQLRESQLCLPHPRILERDFVLVPLASLAPDLIIEGQSLDRAVATMDCSELELLPERLWPLKSINQIVAQSARRVIGKSGKLPWSISEDWAIFLRKTRGGVLIMGRLSFEEMLKEPDWEDNRTYVVISQNAEYDLGTAVETASSFEEGLNLAKAQRKAIWICGGTAIYEASLPYTETLHLTRIDADFEGDTYFPECEAIFTNCLSKIDSNSEAIRYSFELWEKNTSE